MKTTLSLALFMLGLQTLQAAVIEVDTTAFDLVQDKACSLREAVRNAKNDSQSSIDCAAGSGADIITFNSSLNGTTITLDNRLVIDSDIAFHGPGADLLTLSGGGLTRIFINNASGTTTLRDLTLSNGFADDGGALSSSGVLLVERCEFSMNQATAAGGAIHISSGMATITDSTFTGNTASTGAAAIESAGNTSIINSTLSANVSAVATLSSSSQLDLNHITVFDNASAGLLISAGSLSISNTVIGQSNDGADCSNNGTINQNSANHISDGSCSATFSGDPQLGPLADNGGPTSTHRPADESPLVENADLDSCAMTDQRGLARPFNAGCDIGSVEIIPETIFSDSFEQ